MFACHGFFYTRIDATSSSGISIFLYDFSEKLMPEKTAAGRPFDMDQVKFLFNTCRNPGKTKDEIRNMFKTGRYQEGSGACG